MRNKRRQPRQQEMEYSDVTEKDILDLISIYNEFTKTKHPFFYVLRTSGNITQKTWYRYFVDLARIIRIAKAQPREFIQAQFASFRQPTPLHKPVPHPKYLAATASVERWKLYLIKLGKKQHEVPLVDDQALSVMSADRMKRLMKSCGLIDEEEFFLDPTLISQLSYGFVKKHPIFKKLEAIDYYQTTFGITALDLFV